MVRLLRDAGLLAAFAALLFLGVVGFFDSWDGRAVSVRALGPEQSVVRVLLVDAEGERREADWPVAAAEGLGLRIDPRAVPPAELPATLPTTTKQRFSLQFTVATSDGKVRTVPTTTPQALGAITLLWIVAVGVRNMVVAGNPFALERAPARSPGEPTPAAPSGPASPAAAPRARGRAGPPPARPRRGGRR